MPHSFDSYDLKKAQEIITSRQDAKAATNLAFYNCDHWQGGEAWTGPRPVAADKFFAIKMAAIEAAQITRNVIGELCSRHTSGVLGRELHWGLTPTRALGTVETVDPLTGETVTTEGEPTEQEAALMSEAEAVLTAWWDKREVPEILQNMLDGALNTKRSPLRLHVPPGLRDASGNLPSGTIEECIDYIWLQHLGTNEDTLEQQMPSATIFTDKNTRRDIGVFTYKEEDKDFAELTYVDDLGQTVLRILDGDGDVGQARLLPLGERLPMYELTRKWLITPQIVSQQKALNKTKTMQGRNDDLGGFLERTYLNVKWPVDVDSAGVETPRTLYVGAGATNSLQGVEYTDENGVTRVMNPSVVYRDPVSPQTFIESEQSSYLSMLQEGQQLHYALAGDAVVSAVSRIQARDAFHKDLQYSAGKIEAAARWVLETVLAMASFFAGQAGRYESLRAYVEARVDSGPISAEEMTVAADMWERGVWAKERAQSKTGVEDVDAENSRIDQEQAKKQLRQTNMAQAALDEAKRKFDQDGNGEDEPAFAQNGAGA